MEHRNAIPRTERQAQARERALAVLALMRREKLSLRRAAQFEETDPRTVRRYVRSALQQASPRGRYRPTAYDRIARMLNVLTPTGPVAVIVRDSRTASRIGEYMNAVRTYVNTGDSSALDRFKGKTFQAGGKTYTFITDSATLDRLGDARALATEGLYQAVHGIAR